MVKRSRGDKDSCARALIGARSSRVEDGNARTVLGPEVLSPDQSPMSPCDIQRVTVKVVPSLGHLRGCS